MITPSIKDIFYKFDFTDDTAPELENAQNEFFETVDKLKGKHNLTRTEVDELQGSLGSASSAAQYLGFMQGFRLAVTLFTEKGCN